MIAHAPESTVSAGHPLVGGEDDQCVLVESLSLKGRQYFAHTFINQTHLRSVVAHGGDVADVFAEFNHACAYCLRTDRKLTVDHMEPVSKGGDNTRANIVPACLSCNSSKGDRSIFWMLNR